MKRSVVFRTTVVALATVLLAACSDLVGGDPGDTSGGSTGSGGSDESTTECTYPDTPATPPEVGAALEGVTARHNYWRARAGLTPLTWNATLAEEAQAWADNLEFQHDPNRSSGTSTGFTAVGENLYFNTVTSTTAVDATNAWASERADYEFGTGYDFGASPPVGHYTQIVWDGTTDVGCGYAVGTISPYGYSGVLVVCRYGPAGNYHNQVPYPQTNSPCADLDNDDVVQQDDADDTDRTVQ